MQPVWDPLAGGVGGNISGENRRTHRSLEPCKVRRWQGSTAHGRLGLIRPDNIMCLVRSVQLQHLLCFHPSYCLCLSLWLHRPTLFKSLSLEAFVLVTILLETSRKRFCSQSFQAREARTSWSIPGLWPVPRGHSSKREVPPATSPQ